MATGDKFFDKMQVDVTSLPIAEIFTSPQGEGLYTGTLMQFVRLAGCTVGRRLSTVDPPYCSLRQGLEGVGAYPVWQECCTTYDGRKFLCDTDFRKKLSKTPVEICATIPKGVQHVCLTGGEPLMHNLLPLVRDLICKRRVMVHIETSGTILLSKSLGSEIWWEDRELWLTVSPKFDVLPGMIQAADEIKLLVDKDFDIAKLPEEVLRHDLVFIQPVNSTYDIDQANLSRCLVLQHEHPTWRISTQMHKIWKVR